MRRGKNAIGQDEMIIEKRKRLTANVYNIGGQPFLIYTASDFLFFFNVTSGSLGSLKSGIYLSRPVMVRISSVATANIAIKLYLMKSVLENWNSG